MEQMQEDIKTLIEGLIQNIRLLEQSIIKAVVESKTENELILRELTGYLNSTANEVRQLNLMVNQIANATSLFNNAAVKLDGIENKTIEFPQHLNDFYVKLSNLMKQVHSVNVKTANSLYSGMQNLDKKVLDQSEKMKTLEESVDKFSSVLKSISINISKNQEYTNSIIQKLVDGNLDITRSNINNTAEDKRASKKEDSEIIKAKMDMRTKIILSILGSGGVLYFILDTIFKLISK